MDGEREVSARVSIKKDGDSGAIREVAEDISRLPEEAERAASGMGPLQQAFKELSEVADLESVAEELEAVGKALEEAASAETLDRQRQSLEELEKAWTAFGTKAVEELGATKDALKDYETGLETIREEQAKLADPLTASLTKAQEAITTLSNEVEKGFSASERKLTAASRAVGLYREELERAKAAGENVTAGQVEELARLEAAYTEVIGKAARFRAEQAKVRGDLKRSKDVTADQVRQFSTLEGALESVGGKWGAVGIKVLAFVEAATLGWEIGEKLRTTVNNLTDGALDRAIQKFTGMEAILRRVVGTQTELEEETDRLQAATVKLALEGIDVANLSAEQILETYEQLRVKSVELRTETNAARIAYEKWTESQGISSEKLQEQAEALVRVAETIEALPVEKQIAQQELLRDSIQKLLDAYRKTGEEIPESIQKWADSLGVLDSTSEKVLERQKQLVEEIRELFTSAREVTEKEVAALAEALPKALEGIDLQELQLIDPEQFQVGKAALEEFINSAARIGKEVSPEIADAAAQMGILVPQVQIAGEAFHFFTPEASKAAGSMIEVTKEVNAAGKAITVLSQGNREGSDSLIDVTKKVNAAGDAVIVMSQKNREGSDSLVEVTREVNAAGESVIVMSQRTREGSEALGEQGEKAEEATTGLKSLGDEMARVEETARSAGESTKDSADKTSAAGDAFQDAAEKVKKGAEALEEQSGAAEKAGKNLGEAQEATEGLADSQDKASSSLQQTATDLDSLQTKVASVQEAIAAAATAIEGSFQGMVGFSAPLIGELDALQVKAQQVAAALAQAVQGPAS